MESNILTTNESFICVLDSRNATTYYNGSYNSLLTFNIEDAIKIDGIKMMCCVDSFTMPNSIYNINELNSMLYRCRWKWWRWCRWNGTTNMFFDR